MSTVIFALFFIGLAALCVWVIIEEIKHPEPGIEDIDAWLEELPKKPY